MSDTIEGQRFELLYVTVYLPDVVTCNGLAVEPVDQVKVPPVNPKLLAVRSTEPPSQKVNGPLAII
ncbi:hypothetical protein MYP_3385 [Sporocytophaga myxococcoides]|uniref:Uncharacterized protein n=1 Tax=Sporocytophaga myxococcoides TaxID=153721 RepID=A0A098LGN9_9BACT|nr:hypothetical protein MYP_3385 [Sporocytophaga myxococcoides]